MNTIFRFNFVLSIGLCIKFVIVVGLKILANALGSLSVLDENIEI